MDSGSAARRLRDAGLTQVEVAEHVGISTRTLSRYLLRHRRWPLDIVRAVSDLSGIPIEELSPPRRRGGPRARRATRPDPRRPRPAADR